MSGRSDGRGEQDPSDRPKGPERHGDAGHSAGLHVELVVGEDGHDWLKPTTSGEPDAGEAAHAG